MAGENIQRNTYINAKEHVQLQKDKKTVGRCTWWNKIVKKEVRGKEKYTFKKKSTTYYEDFNVQKNKVKTNIKTWSQK